MAFSPKPSAVLLTAGIIPINQLALERSATTSEDLSKVVKLFIYQERARNLHAWQESWEQHTRGCWTPELIRDVEGWLGRGWSTTCLSLSVDTGTSDQAVSFRLLDSGYRILVT